MSKKITLTGVLVVVLLLFTTANVALCAYYVRTLTAYHTLQVVSSRLQVQTAMVARNRSLIQAVILDGLEYGKKNSAMAALLQQYNPLLEHLNIKPKAAAAPTR
jgi:hypothetical protein